MWWGREGEADGQVGPEFGDGEDQGLGDGGLALGGVEVVGGCCWVGAGLSAGAGADVLGADGGHSRGPYLAS